MITIQNEKLFSLIPNYLSTSAAHRYTYIRETTSNLLRVVYIIIYTHILTMSYTTTHSNMQI